MIAIDELTSKHNLIESQAGELNNKIKIEEKMFNDLRDKIKLDKSRLEEVQRQTTKILAARNLLIELQHDKIF